MLPSLEKSILLHFIKTGKCYEEDGCVIRFLGSKTEFRWTCPLLFTLCSCRKALPINKEKALTYFIQQGGSVEEVFDNVL